MHGRIQEPEELCCLLFEASNDALFLLDARSLAVERANGRAATVFRCPAGWFDGKTLPDLCAPGEDSRLRDSIASWADKVPDAAESRFVRADGTEFAGGLRLSVFEFQGAPKALGVIRDLSEESRLQEEHKRSESMASIGMLLGGVAHELNNPLAAILGYSQLLLVQSPENSEFREDLSIIEREAKRCKRLIKSLLAFARKHEHVFVDSDLNALAAEILELKSFDLKRVGIELIQDFAEGLPAVCVDPHQVQQVLFNILNNAEQALEGKKGRVRVSTRREGDKVLLSVADTGPGIAPEHLKRIFEPFFTTKLPGKGTGLGLSICAEIVREHGGELGVESQPGSGACFTLRLPVCGSKPVLPEAHPEKPGRRALVLDDDEDVLRFIGRALQQAGWEARLFSSAGSALEAIRAEAFDIVISDFDMPGMRGDGFYRRVVAARPELARRFVLCTGSVHLAEVRPFAEAEGLPVLVKPFDLEEFERAVRAVRECRVPAIGGAG